MTAYRSAPGTYERIRKDVLEDGSLPDSTFRAVMWAAAKPPGFVLRPEVMAHELGRSLSWANRALTDARKRGYVVMVEDRKPGGAFTRRTSRLVTDKVIAPAADKPRSQPQARNLRAGADLRKRGITAGHNQRADSPRVADLRDIATTETPIAITDIATGAVAPGLAGVSGYLQVVGADGKPVRRRKRQMEQTPYGRHGDCGSELGRSQQTGRRYCARCRRFVADSEVLPGSEWQRQPACERHQPWGARKGCADCAAAADPLLPAVASGAG